MGTGFRKCDKEAANCFVSKALLIRVVGNFNARQISVKVISEVLFTPEICQT